MYYAEQYNKAAYGTSDTSAGLEMLHHNLMIQADRITKLEKRVLELEVTVAKERREPLLVRLGNFIKELKK